MPGSDKAILLRLDPFGVGVFFCIFFDYIVFR